MRKKESDKTIKIRPIYNLLLIGIGQLYGAFTLYRLGVLVIKEPWINMVCSISALALVAWSAYLFYSFSRYYSLKSHEIILRENSFSIFGIELNYADVENFGINTKDSVLSINIFMKNLKEPIPIVSNYMKLKEFHLLTKTLIEKTV